MRTRGMLQGATVVSAVLCLTGCPGLKFGGGSSHSAATNPAPSAPAVPTPSGLVCTSNLLDVFLSWENPGEYREIRVARNGTPVSTLAGSAVSFSETLGAVASYSYTVTGVDDAGTSSAAAECAVTTSALPSVRSLTGTFDARANQVNLAWALPAGTQYDAVQVYRNNVSIAQLGGTAVSYADAGPAAASYQYQVRGVLEGQVSGAVSCSVVVGALGQIRSLVWSVDSSSGDVVLAWQNGQSYDQIEVTCGGEVVATLGGATTTYRYSHVPYGVYEFTVQGAYGVRQTTIASCEGNVGRLVWDQDAVGNISGYHVYVWAEGQTAPSKDAPSYSVGLVTTTPLLDLLTNGVLPTTRTPASFNIALAAYDAYGNVSDLSTSVAFSWQVVSASNLQ
jgi:hypothetical protein